MDKKGPLYWPSQVSCKMVNGELVSLHVSYTRCNWLIIKTVHMKDSCIFHTFSVNDTFGSSTTWTQMLKFDLTGVRTYDLQIINSLFHVPETPLS